MRLAAGAAVMALGVAAGVYASGQNTNGATGPFMGRRRGAPGFPGLGGSVLGPIQIVASQLGLSDAQKDQTKAIAQSHQAEWKSCAGSAKGALRAAGRRADRLAADDRAHGLDNVSG